jgi:hypothetical protein
MESQLTWRSKRVQGAAKLSRSWVGIRADAWASTSRLLPWLALMADPRGVFMRFQESASRALWRAKNHLGDPWENDGPLMYGRRHRTWVCRYECCKQTIYFSKDYLNQQPLRPIHYFSSHRLSKTKNESLKHDRLSDKVRHNLSQAEAEKRHI